MMSWHYVERKENDILISVKVNDDSHATVCTVYGSTSPMNDQYVGASRLTANVNLICAAPDLLKALINLKREIVLSDISNESIEKMYPFIVEAREAIAKALDQ